MSDPEFFTNLSARTLRTERRDRLEAELRAHLEDARDAGAPDAPKRLGDSDALAELFNVVSFRRDGILWILSLVLLGLFAVLVEVMTVWTLHAALMGLESVHNHFPLDHVLNPSAGLTSALVDLVAISWFYPLFWLNARRAFQFAGTTPVRWIVFATTLAFPAIVHALSAWIDPATYHYYFDNPAIVLGSFGLTAVLLFTSYWFRDRRWKSILPTRARLALFLLAAAYVVWTTYLFHLRTPDGTSGYEFATRSWIVVCVVAVREIFEGVTTNILNISLGFLAPDVRWSCVGLALTLWWIYALVGIGRWVKHRYAGNRIPVPLATILALLYLSSILNAGATDRPDVVFSVPTRLISADIEARTIFPWPNLVRYFSRSTDSPNTFPFYHTAWDESRGAFLVEQSAISKNARQFGIARTLMPIGQWSVVPGGSPQTATIRSTDVTIRWPDRLDGAFITPEEPDDDDIDSQALVEAGFSCETDEPFASCFRLSYDGRELFSHRTRSIVVTNAVHSPDDRWILLTLTTRDSLNEYVYLIDLKKSL